MGEVIEFDGTPKDGDKTFMACPCTDEGTSFEVLAIMGDAPFIAALVCPNCEAEIPILNGYIVHKGE